MQNGHSFDPFEKIANIWAAGCVKISTKACTYTHPKRKGKWKGNPKIENENNEMKIALCVTLHSIMEGVAHAHYVRFHFVF